MSDDVNHPGIALAGAPVSWGVDYADDPGNPPWAAVLDQIAAAGYEFTELGPYGYLPTDAMRARRELGQRGLRAVATFAFDDLRDPEARVDVLVRAQRAADHAAAVGARMFVLIDHLVGERAQRAGDGEGRRLSTGEWSAQISGFASLADIARRAGLRPVLHPHAGTFVEYRDEIDRVLDALAPEELGLCVDTGHCVYAGIDPVELLTDHRDRVAHLHLKDVDAAVREQSIRDGRGFAGAVGDGIFCPIGRDMIDFSAVSLTLAAIGFTGVATVEQDRDPSTGADALEDARASLEHLTRAGFGTGAVTR